MAASYTVRYPALAECECRWSVEHKYAGNAAGQHFIHCGKRVTVSQTIVKVWEPAAPTGEAAAGEEAGQ